MLENVVRFHVIHNFPKNYPWYKKFVANAIYFVTGFIIHHRKNRLLHKDLIKARLILKKGDVVMWGNLRELSSLLMGGPLTHASIYLGNKKFIEAVADGVQVAPLHHFFTEYDTMVIMRIPEDTKERSKKINVAIHHALEQVGKPYDFDFTGRTNKFFCTELVNYAFKKAQHNTRLKTMGRFGKKEAAIKKIIHASRALHPGQMAEEGNFDIVFLSHNLKVKEKIILKRK